MKRLLVNATQQEELRVAMVDGQKLYDLDVERLAVVRKKANIYKGKITRVEPSLEAAFVEYGSNRHGFLPLKEISKTYFKPDADLSGKISIKEVISEGQEVVVQVEKEERGNKGAALTTFISLAGRYLVLMPNNPRAGGVSRRIEGEDRDQIRNILKTLELPQGMGMIVRTAGVGKSFEELQWDLDYLLQIWGAINTAAEEKPAPFLIYQESNAIIRALRDNFRNDVGEIQIDDEDTYAEAYSFMKQVMPHNLSKLKLYQSDIPLFSRYQIESQIESAYLREVTLPSGGAIVIDRTEALISIDINSAKATKGSDIEETALNTNLEAADEIARQLRIRDLGGLIVIDFIDMLNSKNQREVESRLKEALQMDRARVQIGRISRFGLLEMSRQRLRSALGEATHSICPHCNGQGTIRSTESQALSIFRILEEHAIKDTTAQIIVQVPVEIGTYLLNEKRTAIASLENNHEIEIVLIPNKSFTAPHFEIERIKASESNKKGSASYTMATEWKDEELEEITSPAPVKAAPAETPAVSNLEPETPRPPRKEDSKGIIKKIFSIFSGDNAAEEPTVEVKPKSTKPKNTQRRSSSTTTKSPNKGKQSGQNNRSPNSSESGQSKPRNQQNKQRRKPSDNQKNESKPTPNRRQNTKSAKNEQAENKPAVDSTQNKPESTKDEDNKGSSTRRSKRGGRQRKRRTNETPTNNETVVDSSASNAEQQAPAKHETDKSADTATAKQQETKPKVAKKAEPPVEKASDEKKPEIKPTTDKKPASSEGDTAKPVAANSATDSKNLEAKAASKPKTAPKSTTENPANEKPKLKQVETQVETKQEEDKKEVPKASKPSNQVETKPAIAKTVETKQVETKESAPKAEETKSEKPKTEKAKAEQPKAEPAAEKPTDKPAEKPESKAKHTDAEDAYKKLLERANSKMMQVETKKADSEAS